MKHSYMLLSALLLFLANDSRAQVTNLLVDGSATSFNMTSSDAITWSCNIPAGSTVVVQIWYDLNGNGKVDSASDVLFESISQTDGDTTGHNGPPDMDGQKNGAILLDMPVGIAPGEYVLVFSEGGTSESVSGTVNPLASPAHTISGTVTVPSGKSAANIFVQASRNGDHQPQFWVGVTNSSGNYAIQMNSDTSGNPWQVAIVGNPYPDTYIAPVEQDVVVSGNPGGVDFAIAAAAAQVAGYLKDESGTPLVNANVSLSRLDTINTMSTVVYYSKTDANGLFRFGIAGSDIVSGRTWRLFASRSDSQLTTTELSAVNESVINQGDSLVRNLVLYKADSQIKGTIKINGSVPNFPVEIAADNSQYAQAVVMADPTTGNFTLPVTDKVPNYNVFPLFLPQGYAVPSVTAQPGQIGIILDATATAVRVSGPVMPTKFDLKQSYPNPFNPTTMIVYDVATTGNVKISVYNVLGQKVATLVDGIRLPGEYNVSFDGSRFASGMYMYVMSAGSFTSMRKFVLVK